MGVPRGSRRGACRTARTTLAFGTAVLLGVLARAPEPDEDVSAGCGPGVAKRRPAETLLIVPGAALQHSTPIGQARRRPLKDIAGGVEHAVRARSRRVADHGGRAARSPLSAVEACRIPCATAWKAAAVAAPGSLLPLRLGR